MVRAAAAILAAALTLGCAGRGGVEKVDLPASPVALLQRSEEDSLRRLDALGDLEKRRGAGAKEGVAVLENLDAMFGGAPALERRLAAFQGHLVLLDPRTGETSRLAEAPPQARPAAWSPDRRRLLLSGTWRGLRQLFTWDREADRVEIATAGPAHHVNGCIAAGDRLVAVRVEPEALASGRSRLVASGPGGGPLRPIGEEGLHFALACSPVRPQIAFVRVDPEDGRARLRVQGGDRHQEGVDRHVGQALQLGFQPAAVRAVRIAEDRERTGTAAAHVLDRVGQGQCVEVDARQRVLALGGEVALCLHVVQVAEQEVLAARVHVSEVGAHRHFEDTRPRRRTDLAEAGRGVERLQALYQIGRAHV